MKHWISSIELAVLLLIGYEIWSHTGKVQTPPRSSAPVTVFHKVGTDQQKGNLLGVQPFVEPLDYATPEAFRAKMQHYLSEAQKSIGLMRRPWLFSRSIRVPGW